VHNENIFLFDDTATGAIAAEAKYDLDDDLESQAMQPFEAQTKTPDELFSILLAKMQQYHPSSNFTLVKKAYKLAKDAHEGQKRKSGEPYIIHPIEVAIILANLEMDRETIAAGILHDIIEDTDYGYNDIKEMFSEEVANLVDGVTKLRRYAEQRQDSGKSKEEEQAENFRKMFLAMANDIRVVIIKIADRLHNLRTLRFMPEDKQQRIGKNLLIFTHRWPAGLVYPRFVAKWKTFLLDTLITMHIMTLEAK